jgi:hypothetical protein
MALQSHKLMDADGARSRVTRGCVYRIGSRQDDRCQDGHERRAG